MTVHLVKLCVGAASIEDLARWQAMPRNLVMHGRRKVAYHTTFQKPTRQADLLDGGSLYWVIKGTILVRQRDRRVRRRPERRRLAVLSDFA